MASGLPVVATDVGGVREFVADGVGGAVVPPGNAAALADALERYLAQPDRARAAGTHNRHQGVGRVFVAQQRRCSLLDVYRRVIDSRRGGERASRMKVAIRDDDTSYFTTPESLDRVYGDVWDRVPVCLAVVPFAIGYEQPGIPPEHWHSGESFALERNPALVSFLRELIATETGDDRAPRLHASGLPGRVRVSGRA